MIYKLRLLQQKLSAMVRRFPVVVVTGARQVGKSTLLQHVLADWDHVVFDPVVDVAGAREDPELFLDNHPPPLVLDEIQFAPQLVPVIKRRVDSERDEPGRYVLTGSQQWAVMKEIGESLAGRAVFLDLHGFSLAEIADATRSDHWLRRYLENPEAFVALLPPRLTTQRTLYEQLWAGFLPEADTLEPDWIDDFYRAYLRTYVERDVRSIADIDDWQQFGRFVRLIAALTATEINHSQLGRELGITPQTCRRWLAILSATFQWHEIPPYHGNTIKRVSKKPKGHFSDTGLACSLQAVSTARALAGHPLTGALFESAVVGEIRKLSATIPAPPNLYHWRSHGGAEVDVILERDGRFHPVEIKLNSNPGRGALRGIRAFRETYTRLDIAPGLIICPADEGRRIGERDALLPWDSS